MGVGPFSITVTASELLQHAVSNSAASSHDDCGRILVHLSSESHCWQNIMAVMKCVLHLKRHFPQTLLSPASRPPSLILAVTCRLSSPTSLSAPPLSCPLLILLSPVDCNLWLHSHRTATKQLYSFASLFPLLCSLRSALMSPLACCPHFSFSSLKPPASSPPGCSLSLPPPRFYSTLSFFSVFLPSPLLHLPSAFPFQHPPPSTSLSSFVTPLISLFFPSSAGAQPFAALISLLLC